MKEITGTITASPSAFQQIGLYKDSNAIAAQWNRETDTVTFDWPLIEAEAANETSSMRGIAKILLAARDTT